MRHAAIVNRERAGHHLGVEQLKAQDIDRNTLDQQSLGCGYPAGATELLGQLAFDAAQKLRRF
jgi:hypothetical protein